MIVTSAICIYSMYGRFSSVHPCSHGGVVEALTFLWCILAAPPHACFSRWAVAYMAQANPLIQPKRTNWFEAAEH